MSKRVQDLYTDDLDAAFEEWLKKNPDADYEAQRQWTFKGYQAWKAGYDSAMRSLGKSGDTK